MCVRVRACACDVSTYAYVTCFITGWLKYTPDVMPFYAPTINSYKRFVVRTCDMLYVCDTCDVVMFTYKHHAHAHMFMFMLVYTHVHAHAYVHAYDRVHHGHQHVLHGVMTIVQVTHMCMSCP